MIGYGHMALPVPSLALLAGLCAGVSWLSAFTWHHLQKGWCHLHPSILCLQTKAYERGAVQSHVLS